jgi:hypothetical protein
MTNEMNTLINAAEAVLDSEAGAISMGELAEALYNIDSTRDYREDNPRIDFGGDEVHDAGDHRPMDPFRTDPDTGQLPEGTSLLLDIDHGRMVVDKSGERFRVLGYGPVQGTVTMSDADNHLFYAAGDMIFRPVSA